MSRWLKLACVLLLVLASLPVTPASAQTTNPCTTIGTLPTGAIYYISLPVNPATLECVTTSDLVIYAHGYVPEDGLSMEIPPQILYLPNPSDPASPIFIPDMINTMGYAFAFTSYRQKGLAVVQAVNDILDLEAFYKLKVGVPNRIYLAGASEGSLIATLALEKHPEDFSGGLAMCGPIGDFRAQVNYWGDFRVVFDYFFKGVLPSGPVAIPMEVMLKWDAAYAPTITTALVSGPLKTAQLLSVTRAPIDPADRSSHIQTALGVLWYNAFATNDAILKLGGQPFDNSTRKYQGSFNDLRLNQRVQRFKADPAALKEIARNYQTSGVLRKPLVTLHTISDPIVPYRQAALYTAKVLKNSPRPALVYGHIPVLRYGHCNFQQAEILAGFYWLVGRTGGQSLNIDAFRFNAAEKADFDTLIQATGK